MSDTHFDEANEFLSATGVPSAKFPTVGTTVAGHITQKPEVQQQRDFDSGELLTWDDGNPRKQVKVVLVTDERDPEIEDDDGSRALYIKANLQRAVQQALRKAGAKLAIGGHLIITYVKDGEAKKKGLNPPKIYSAVYTPPSEAAVDEAIKASPEPDQPATQQAPQSSVPDFTGWTPEQISAYMQAQQAQQRQAS